MEDRGTAYYIFINDRGNETFDSGGLMGKLHATLSVPIGWQFAPDRVNGVVLTNVFGIRLDARLAYIVAQEGLHGFKVRDDHNHRDSGIARIG